MHLSTQSFEVLQVIYSSAQNEPLNTVQYNKNIMLATK